MALFKYILCLSVLAVSLRNARAHVSKETEAILLDYMRDSLAECAKDFSLNMDELKEHKSTGDIEGLDKCFFACILKKKGVINEEGKYDFDTGIKGMREIITNDDDFKILESTSKTCVSVNDEEVSDGTKGCDRAFLLVSCINKHKHG